MPGSSGAEKEQAAAAEIPVGRMGRKWDIAMAVVYLASPAAGGEGAHAMRAAICSSLSPLMAVLTCVLVTCCQLVVVHMCRSARMPTDGHKVTRCHTMSLSVMQSQWQP